MKKEKPKVLFAATVVKTHINEFHLPYLQLFQSVGWETHVAAKNDFLLTGEECRIPGCDHYTPVPFARSPLARSNLKAYRQLKKLIDREHYTLIHCHTPVGGLITRLAARHARKKGTRVYYTAHGFHFFQGAPLINWLLYYPAERLMAHFTDVLITINREDYERARHFAAKRVEYVPGVGVPLEKFERPVVGRTEKRRACGVPEKAFLLLMVGELIPRKNQMTVLEVLARLKDKQVHCVFCGQGELDGALKAKTRTLGLEEQVHFLGFRYDLPDIYGMADLFIFPTLHEGLPVALMEAMTAGLPVVGSDVRGNRDLIEPGKGGLLISSPYDVSGLAEAVRTLQKQPELRRTMGEWNRKAVQPYALDRVREKMKCLYGLTEQTD